MRTVYILLGAVVLTSVLHAQAPKPAGSVPASPTTEVVLTATSANVSEAGKPVSIRIFRWSTDEERTQLVTALTAPPPAPARQGGGGQGQAQGGGRGRGRGGDAAPQTPIAVFTAALQKSPTVGFLWTDDVSGYSLKHAWRTAQPDGTEKIVLITDRRLGAHSRSWSLAGGATPTDYAFTLLELRVNPKGGEGKSSLTASIAADPAAKQLALENYAAAPAILTNVKIAK